MPVTRSQWSKRLGVGALAVLALGGVVLQTMPADARVIFDLGWPTHVAPPPYYAYARPADYSPSPATAGAISFGFGGGHHWQ
jgi:hypothetical protein